VVTVFAIACAFSAGPALAQSTLAQPQSVQPTGLYDYAGSYYAQDDESASPSDAIVPEAPMAVSGCAGGCASDCNSCCDSCCDAGPWTLFGPFMEENAPAWSAGGWISSGVYNNGYGINNNGPLGFRNLAEEYTLDQLWGWMERGMDTSYGWDVGFRADFIFGVDGPDTEAFGDQGWDFGWFSDGRNGAGYGSAIPQLYGEIGYGDLSVKLGHFYTIMGYEVVQDTGNFFYSHAYTMYYGEPFTHTGVLASYALNDYIALSGGWTMGWDSGFGNRNGASTFLGGVTTQFSESSAVAWTVSFGDQGQDFASGDDLGDVFLSSLVITTQLTPTLNSVILSDMGRVTGLGAGDHEWYSLVGYLFLELNDRWAVGARTECFQDTSGCRINADGGGIMGMVPRGSQGNYWDVSLGANWRPNANVVVRPELRWDWFDPSQPVFVSPYDNGARNSQFTYGVSTVLTY
jgi:hypothetical protein